MSRRRPIKSLGAGPAVEVGNQLAGGGEHDGVESGRPVGRPGGEGIVGGFGKVADVNTAVIKVEGERCQLAVTEGE